MDVALRAASILRNHDFPFSVCCPLGELDLVKSHVFSIFSKSFKWKYTFIWLKLSIGIMLKRSVRKNMPSALVRMSNGSLEPELSCFLSLGVFAQIFSLLLIVEHWERVRTLSLENVCRMH